MGMYLLCIAVGAVVGVAVGQNLWSFVAGGLIGWLFARQDALAHSLRKLRARVEAAEHSAAARKAAPVAKPEPTQVPAAVSPATATRVPPDMPDAPPAPPVTSVRQVPVATTASVPVARPPVRPTFEQPPEAPRQPAANDDLLHKAWRWFTQGNVPVKIGILVLFAGVAALLKYAHDAHLLVLPLTVRVGLVTLAALAALVFGWLQRERRRGFGLSLQGGAIGVLVLVVFASLRLYGLLAPGPAFVLLVLLVTGAGVLAVMQDAMALAVLALLAGFAAPILASTGHGSHVTLFGFYLVLNLAIFGIAWWKSWRVLNLLGFVATFVIATAWGVLNYRPQDFASTEPFLVLSFLLYLTIPWLYLRNRFDGGRKWMDACLLFGNPLISLLLQGSLLDWQGTPLAISAALASLIYLLGAWGLRDQDELGILRDAWLMLAMALATLAVPLAFSAGVTAGVFALEGAGMVWLALRQKRRVMPWIGLAMQVLAAGTVLSLWGEADASPSLPVLNREFMTTLILVLATAASCRWFQRNRHSVAGHAQVAVVVGAFALWAWLFGTFAESIRLFDDRNLMAALWVVVALTIWALAELARGVDRTSPLGRAAAWLAASGWAVLLVCVLLCLAFDWQPLAGWLLLACAVSVLAGWRMLVCLRAHAGAIVFAQTGWWWWVAMLAATAVYRFADKLSGVADSWQVLLFWLAPIALWLLVMRRPGWLEEPAAQAFERSRRWLSHSLAGVLGLVCLVALFSAGQTQPLPFIPVFNPVGLLLLGIALGTLCWLVDADTPIGLRRMRALILGVGGLVLATSMTLRIVHHLADVPWDHRIVDSSLAELSLTVVWSVFGVSAWLWGSRRGQYPVWLAGAITMGVVLLKLLLVDRDSLGDLFGIASFIAFGVLCIVLGYLAPRPPRRVPVR